MFGDYRLNGGGPRRFHIIYFNLSIADLYHNYTIIRKLDRSYNT